MDILAESGSRIAGKGQLTGWRTVWHEIGQAPSASLAVRAIDGVRPQPAFPHFLQGEDQPACLAAGKLCEGLFEQSLTKPFELLGIHADPAGESLGIFHLAGRRPGRALPLVAARAWPLA